MPLGAGAGDMGIGATSGQYNWPWDNAADSDYPGGSHAQVNKDDTWTPSGRRPLANGHTGFSNAKDVAQRHSKKAWDDLRRMLASKKVCPADVKRDYRGVGRTG